VHKIITLGAIPIPKDFGVLQIHQAACMLSISLPTDIENRFKNVVQKINHGNFQVAITFLLKLHENLLAKEQLLDFLFFTAKYTGILDLSGTEVIIGLMIKPPKNAVGV
jgi:hypothetical protein